MSVLCCNWFSIMCRTKKNHFIYLYCLFFSVLLWTCLCYRQFWALIIGMMFLCINLFLISHTEVIHLLNSRSGLCVCLFVCVFIDWSKTFLLLLISFLKMYGMSIGGFYALAIGSSVCQLIVTSRPLLADTSGTPAAESGSVTLTHSLTQSARKRLEGKFISYLLLLGGFSVFLRLSGCILDVLFQSERREISINNTNNNKISTASTNWGGSSLLLFGLTITSSTGANRPVCGLTLFICFILLSLFMTWLDRSVYKRVVVFTDMAHVEAVVLSAS